MDTEYGLSLVIPTFNKAAYLDLTLESLQYQTFPVQKYEIVVVDDGSADRTEQVVASHKRTLNIRYVQQDNRGRSAARNQGTMLAQSELLVFIDDDLLLVKNFLEEHFRFHENQRRTVAHGRIFELPFLKFFQDPTAGVLLESERDKMSANPSILQKFLVRKSDIPSLSRIDHQKKLSSLERYIIEILMVPDTHESTKHLRFLGCTGGNISMRKELLLEAGGFDPEFARLWGGEDMELGYRLQQLGADFQYLDRAINYHMTHLRKNYQEQLLKSFSLFYQKHQDPIIQALPQLLLNEWKGLPEFCEYIAKVVNCVMPLDVKDCRNDSA